MTAAAPAPKSPPPTMTGSEAQIEWALRIREQIDIEFDRVAAALRGASATRSPSQQADTEAIVAILEEIRTRILLHESAGYFIKEWQEAAGQVRCLIVQDPRYQALRRSRPHLVHKETPQ